MLDTNICIYVMRGRLPQLTLKFSGVAGKLSISTITLAELHYGVSKSVRQAENGRALEQFCGQVTTLAFSAAAAEHFGDLRAHLERAGKPVGAPDILIGAHARAENLTLVTNNLREFDRMPGLRVENWV